MEALIVVLRRLADGVRGPMVHALIDELEAAGHVPAAPAPAPAPAALPAIQVPFSTGGTK